MFISLLKKLINKVKSGRSGPLTTDEIMLPVEGSSINPQEGPIGTEMSMAHRDQRQMLAVGGLASRLVRKLLKRHKKDPEVQSDIITIKSKIDDIDNELGGIGSENVELEKEIIRDLEVDKRYLIEALEEIDVTGRPLDFDETGYPVLDASGGLDF